MLLAIAVTAAIVAHGGSRPSATTAGADSIRDAKGQVPTSAGADGAQRAEASGSSRHSPTLAGGNDTGEIRLNHGRQPRDHVAYARAIRAGRNAMASWPTAPTALSGAILPHRRIVAYYGNPNSKKMGVLGEYPEPQMLTMLDETVAMWRTADTSTPVIPAIHLVTVVAQGSAGPDGKWRRREDPQMIEQAYRWAQSREGLLFVDVQAGRSTLQEELPLLLKYLERPDVHLGLDPEFYMHHKREGVRPGVKVGQMMSSDVNYAIDLLGQVVRDKNLPPKILVVHRFRADMVPDAENIKPTPAVQVVMHMDGWGPAWLKFDSYKDYIVQSPVAFTGFKIFYRQDAKTGDPILTPVEVLRLLPAPMYVQYQ
ncbi:MAG TPA: hypothetical protein VHT71_21610 [Methylomirabilota bacterium]|jgi:hypothetical protein|nr:hypothetical protein [Methylomirabilota bacterium]